MTKRAGKSYPADPHQWYREPRSTVEQVFDSLDFPPGVIWDASCGVGNILDVAHERGFRTFGSDIVDRPGRHPRHAFRLVDFTRLRDLPFVPPLDGEVSLFCNPPYGKVAGVANMGEKFVYHARRHFRDRLARAAFVLPIEFMCGQDRYFDLYERDRPSHSLICCQRPSMPPGAMVEDMGAKAFSGGMADYVVLVWTRGGPFRTEAIFMRPTAAGRPPVIEARKR